MDIRQVKTNDKSCRCCGNGKELVCEDCEELLQEGYAFFLETDNKSTEKSFKLTHRKVAVKVSSFYEHGHPNVPMVPGIYFIQETELKTFLGNEYRTIFPLASRFLRSSPKWKHSAIPRANDSARHVVGIPHE